MKLEQRSCDQRARSTKALLCLRLKLRWIALLIVQLSMLFSSATAPAQLIEEAAVLTTKDLGGGSLVVEYFNERGGTDCLGYLHVQVSTMAGMPSPRERNLEIVFYAHSNSWPSLTSVAYHRPIKLLEGNRSATESIRFFIPNSEGHSNNQSPLHWDIKVTEDGRDIELSRTFAGRAASRPPATIRAGIDRAERVWHMARRFNAPYCILRLIDEAAPPADQQGEFYQLLMAQRNFDAGFAQSAASSIYPMPSGISQNETRICNVRTISTAPDQWQYYLQFKIVVMDHGGFEKLRSERKKTADALKQYVAAGGGLLLVGNYPLSGKRLVDRWLLGKDNVVSERAAGWRGVQGDFVPWWSGDAFLFAHDGMTLVPNVNMQPNRDPLRSRNIPRPPPLPGQTPNEARLAEMKATIDEVNRKLNIKRTARGDNALALDGCARDMLIALETVAEAKLGKLRDLVHGLDIAFVEDMSGMAMGGEGSGSALLYDDPYADVYSWMSDLRNWLHDRVGDFESWQPTGCAVRPYVLGNIAVIEPSLKAFTLGKQSSTVAEFANLPAQGINSIYDGQWNWRNLIQSVGRPPVWMFGTIVMLFGLVLGPGLLIMTAWLRRRSLLIFLIPAVSLVTTLLIVFYAVVHEGFDTRIRVTSVLAVDELTGDGFAWSRQTYFSGWPPREGLSIPHHVFARPVAPDGFDGSVGDIEPQRGVESDIYVGESQSQWVGWLRSREQQQLLIGHPAKVNTPLKVRRVSSNRAAIRNTTDETLPFAVVRDGGEGYFITAELAPGSEIEVSRQSFEDIAAALSRHRADSIATLPDGLTGIRSWAGGRFVPAVVNDPTSLELLDYIWNMYLSEKVPMPRNGFVTIVQNSDAVVIPLAGTVSDSKYLVVGRLAW